MTDLEIFEGNYYTLTSLIPQTKQLNSLKLLFITFVFKVVRHLLCIHIAMLCWILRVFKWIRSNPCPQSTPGRDKGKTPEMCSKFCDGGKHRVLTGTNHNLRWGGEWEKMCTKGNNVLQLRNKIMVGSVGKEGAFGAIVSWSARLEGLHGYMVQVDRIKSQWTFKFSYLCVCLYLTVYQNTEFCFWKYFSIQIKIQTFFLMIPSLL